MGCDLVKTNASHFSYTEIFEEQCPFYMSIGMTYDEFWEGSVDRVIPYKKAFMLKRKRANADAWLQGRYIYDVLNTVVPALRGLSKEPVLPYVDEPYPYDKKEVEERKHKEMMEQAQKYREYVAAVNAERQRKGEEKNVNEN